MLKIKKACINSSFLAVTRLKKLNKYNSLMLLCFLSCIACGDDTLPKPKAYLSLKYAENTYKKLSLKRPYSFDISEEAIVKEAPNNWLKITYPNLKASIDITYRKPNNNLQELLAEAERLVFKHTLKAESISSKDFENEENKVFGSVYEITGNAASQIQFHATDSLNHFIKGSLYFYVKPNYDSIFPAVNYIKKDIIKIMETLQWK